MLFRSYDLEDNQQKIEFAQAVSRLLAALDNAVEREVYTGRAAEMSGISRDALATEVGRALKQRRSQARRQEVRASLRPTAERQPRNRSLRYENPRSAQAEEGLVQLLLLDGELDCDLSPEMFSSPMLAGIYRLILDGRAEGRAVSAAVLTASLEPAEAEHLAAILQRPVSMANSRQALADYIEVIRAEYDKRGAGRGQDLLLIAKDTFKNKKGYGGKRRV